jgi:hypothetical protein
LYFLSTNSFFTSVLTFVNLQHASSFSIPIIVPFNNFYIFLLLGFRANIFLLKISEIFWCTRLSSPFLPRLYPGWLSQKHTLSPSFFLSIFPSLSLLRKSHFPTGEFSIMEP